MSTQQFHAGQSAAAMHASGKPTSTSGKPQSQMPASVSIDLNSDLGENTPDRVVSDDDAMLGIVTSANVSCGFHAGNPEGIRATLAAAVKRGVVIGAHPSYNDYEGFGRRARDVSASALQAQIEYQLGALLGLAAAAGATVAYVKPHGGLYHALLHDTAQTNAVIAAIKAIDPSLIWLGLAGSLGNQLASATGLRVASEAFADRAYNPDGTLVSRSEPGAVLHDPEEVASRVLRLVQEGQIEAMDGSVLSLEAQSLCFHGDSPGAVAMAERARSLLEANGVTLAPFAGSSATPFAGSSATPFAGVAQRSRATQRPCATQKSRATQQR